MVNVPRARFQGVASTEAGMQFEAETAEGSRLVTVTKVSDDMVTVDANHALAGIDLTFDVPSWPPAPRAKRKSSTAIPTASTPTAAAVRRRLAGTTAATTAAAAAIPKEVPAVTGAAATRACPAGQAVPDETQAPSTYRPSPWPSRRRPFPHFSVYGMQTGSARIIVEGGGKSWVFPSTRRRPSTCTGSWGHRRLHPRGRGVHHRVPLPQPDLRRRGSHRFRRPVGGLPAQRRLRTHRRKGP